MKLQKIIVMSAKMLVSLTPEKTEDGAGSTAVFSNSNELFLTDCLLERLSFIPAGDVVPWCGK